MLKKYKNNALYGINNEYINIYSFRILYVNHGFYYNNTIYDNGIFKGYYNMGDRYGHWVEKYKDLSKEVLNYNYHL